MAPDCRGLFLGEHTQSELKAQTGGRTEVCKGTSGQMGGHLVLHDHEAAAVTGVQAQTRQKLQICRHWIHPLPLLILSSIHIACTVTITLSRTPRARWRLQDLSRVHAMPRLELLGEYFVMSLAPQAHSKQQTWIEGADPLIGEAVGGLDMLLQQQQHAHRQGGSALPPAMSLVLSSLGSTSTQSSHRSTPPHLSYPLTPPYLSQWNPRLA